MDCTLETISSSLSWEHVTPLTTPVTISTISPLVCILSSGGMTLEDVFLQLTADDAREEDPDTAAEAAGEEDAP